MTPSSMQNDVYAINAKYNPCHKFTETIYKCKSFLKELQRNDKYLHSLNQPSKMSKVSSLKTAHIAGQTALSTSEEREIFCEASVTAKKEEINETKCEKRMQGNIVKGTEETYHQNKENVSKDVVTLKTNNCASSRDVGISVIPIVQPGQNIHPSQLTLIEVRRKLQNLHNVQTYQDMSRSTKKQKWTNQMDQINEIDSFITNPIMNISSEYFELNRSEDCLSSLADSSHTSKTYQCSSENLTLQNTYSKGFSQYDIRNNLSFVPTESHLCSRNAKLQSSESYENDEYKECLWENILDCNSNHKIESNSEVNKDAIKTNTLFNTRDNISERIFYILSPENKDNQTQNETLLEERFATKKFSNTFDKKQYRENVTISQNSSQSKISNNSNNKENKSTILLLQEALHFKNTLLTHSRMKCPTSNEKQGDIADESSLISNNNFPSMIIDIKEEEPVVSNSYDKINQRYICLEMKQRRDLFPQYLKKVNTLAHCEDQQNTKSQDYIRETSSEYFSITDLASHNNNNNVEIKNNVSLKPPIYEKVISITIPVDMDERSMQTKTVLQNIRTCVQENLRKNATSDIDNNIADKRSPTMLKFEDLILERVKNIRDYIDTFLQSQNIAIFKARRALQCQGKNDFFRCSDEASHVVVYNRSIAPSSSNSTEQIGSSKKSSDILTNIWPNYIEEYKQKTENDLKCSSDLHLKRNPGMFALITPIKNKFSIKNNTQQSGIPTELEKEEIDLSLPEVLTYSHKIDSKSTHKISDSITTRCEEHSNTENNITDKGIDVNADFHKHKKQTQVTESKPSYFSLDVANVDAKVIHTAREDYLNKSNCNSISRSNSYFTDEEIISDVKMDNVSSKSISDMKHSHLKLNAQKKTKQNVTKQQISVDECLNIVTPSELPSEYSNLTILINSNLIPDKHDYSTNPKTTSSLMMLKENDFIFDPAASLLPLSLNKKNETLNTDSTLLNNLKQNDEISIGITNLSPRIECYSTKPFQTYSQVKSDMSLITNRRKDLKVNIYPKKSSFLMRYNTKSISGTLHEPYAKLHNDKNKCIKNKLRLTSQSKSIISPQRESIKSCIPILKNRLESSHRIKHQGHARSPLRSPLTMLGEKTCTKVHATEEVVRNDNASINRHLHVDRTVTNLTKLNLQKDIFNKDSEKLNMTFKENIPKKHSEIVSSDQNVKSLAINKEHSDKSDINRSKSDTSIMQHIKKIASKEMIVISIMANDDLRKKYPADLFILNTKNISPTTDLLIHKNKLWTITVEKKEKEVTAKPSIADTCTSMSNLH